MLTGVTWCSKETKPIVELLLIGSSLEKNRSGPVSEDLHRQGLYKRGARGKKNPHQTLGTKGRNCFFSSPLEQGCHRCKVPHLLSLKNTI